jgi:predicted transglutaminase-like cysteine proteinase
MIGLAMHILRLLSGLAIGLVLANANVAAAHVKSLRPAATGASLDDSDLVVAPSAFQNFCRNHPDQCLTHGRAGVAKIDAKALTELAWVDTHVNRAIRPLPAAADAYQLGVKAGSCNEYAVEKRRWLLAHGWSAAALSLAVVRLPDGRGHLVLTVRTDLGDLVLDNLTNRVVSVDQTDYTWIERQSTIHPMLWVRVGGLSAGSDLARAPTLRAQHQDLALAANEAR